MTTTEQIAAAVDAMECAEWPSAVALLIGVLPADDPGIEATVRALLAQALHSSGEPDQARQQAVEALIAAEKTDDRGLIWRCMALIESMRIIEDGRL